MAIKSINIDSKNGITIAPPVFNMSQTLLMTNRNKVYWISQLSGWSLWALLNIIGMLSFDLFSWKKIILFLFLCFAGLCFTHILKNIIKKYSWVNLPLKKIIPRILLSSLALGIILSAFYFSSQYFSGVLLHSEIKIGTPFVLTANLSSIILVWLLIYFAVHLFENYKRVEIESLIWEAAVKDFELKTLKSQLNPHFMFNAMNSIRALIEEDPENA